MVVVDPRTVMWRDAPSLDGAVVIWGSAVQQLARAACVKAGGRWGVTSAHARREQALGRFVTSATCVSVTDCQLEAHITAVFAKRGLAADPTTAGRGRSWRTSGG